MVNGWWWEERDESGVVVILKYIKQSSFSFIILFHLFPVSYVNQTASKTFSNLLSLPLNNWSYLIRLLLS